MSPRTTLVLLHLAIGIGWVWQRRAVWFPVLIAPLVAAVWLVMFLTHAFVPITRAATGPGLDRLVKGPRDAGHALAVDAPC